MPTITKKALIQQISRKNGMNPTDVRLIVQELFDYVQDSLSEGNRFEFRGFGVFEIVRRKPKVGRNPKAPEKTIIIPARNAVKFTAGKRLKELLQASKARGKETS